jgi:hypothetical protein
MDREAFEPGYTPGWRLVRDLTSPTVPKLLVSVGASEEERAIIERKQPNKAALRCPHAPTS